MPQENHHHFVRKCHVIFVLINVLLLIMLVISGNFTQDGLHTGERRLQVLMLILQQLT